VVVEPIDPLEPVIDASAVRLVAEIVSPSNAATDRVLKTHYYADAGIPWYLLVEPDDGTITLRLFALDGDHYVPAGTGRPGAPLALTGPVVVTIDPADLP
jgi:Uma2 family endonuclease